MWCWWQHILTSVPDTDACEATRTNSNGSVAVPKCRDVNWKEWLMTGCILPPANKQWSIAVWCTWDSGKTRPIHVPWLPIHLSQMKYCYLASSMVKPCAVLCIHYPQRSPMNCQTVGLYPFYWDYKRTEAFDVHLTIKVVVSCQNV